MFRVNAEPLFLGVSPYLVNRGGGKTRGVFLFPYRGFLYGFTFLCFTFLYFRVIFGYVLRRFGYVLVIFSALVVRVRLSFAEIWVTAPASVLPIDFSPLSASLSCLQQGDEATLEGFAVNLSVFLLKESDARGVVDDFPQFLDRHVVICGEKLLVDLAVWQLEVFAVGQCLQQETPHSVSCVAEFATESGDLDVVPHVRVVWEKFRVVFILSCHFRGVV